MRILGFIAAFAGCALANVEKTIFLGPETVNIPSQQPTFDQLHINVLSPENSSIRTYVEAEFPREPAKRGKETWLLLDNLTPGQRYEVRICWAATQPTAFTLRTHELSAVWETPELITSLSEYSYARIAQSKDEVAPDLKARSRLDREASMLFLQVFAAADYFTTDKELMQNVPAVYVDIILDPFILNVLPRSLAPTAAYIVVVAAVSFFVARWILAWVQQLAASDLPPEKKNQ